MVEMKAGLMLNGSVKETVCNINDFKLCKENDFYFIVFPDNTTMVNTSGSKQDIINEMERWKKEIDSNNPFMLEIENGFIKALSEKKINSCGECEYSEEQRNIHGESRYECITCTKLNCGTLRFEINKRCPLLKALSAEK